MDEDELLKNPGQVVLKYLSVDFASRAKSFLSSGKAGIFGMNSFATIWEGPQGRDRLSEVSLMLELEQMFKF